MRARTGKAIIYKMRFSILAISLCVTFCLTGCFTLESASIRATGEEHIHVANEGWYLFHKYPLVCGNADKNGFLPFVFFRNDVKMDKLQERFFDYANEHGKKNKDMNYLTSESVLFEIPGLSFPLPIPYLLTQRTIQLSGVLE